MAIDSVAGLLYVFGSLCVVALLCHAHRRLLRSHRYALRDVEEEEEGFPLVAW